MGVSAANKSWFLAVALIEDLKCTVGEFSLAPIIQRSDSRQCWKMNPLKLVYDITDDDAH